MRSLASSTMVEMFLEALRGHSDAADLLQAAELMLDLRVFVSSGGLTAVCVCVCAGLFLVMINSSVLL